VPAGHRPARCYNRSGGRRANASGTTMPSTLWQTVRAFAFRDSTRAGMLTVLALRIAAKSVPLSARGIVTPANCPEKRWISLGLIGSHNRHNGRLQWTFIGVHTDKASVKIKAFAPSASQ
jgi:hypothetical protein